MSYLGGESTSSGSVGDADFDVNLLSGFLFQCDGMPKLMDDDLDLQASTTATAASTDGTGSSDDADASPDSSVSALASQSPETGKTSDRKAKRRAQVAVSARRHRYRKKHEMLDLRKEVADLTDQLHSLRSKHKLLRPDGAVAEAEECTMAQRHKRRQVEKVNEQLRRALVMQRRFFASMQGLVLNSPITNAELNMSSLLHTFTHLGRSAYARRRDYLAMCTDLKADLAVQILVRETEGMNFAGPPAIITRSVPTRKAQQQIVTTVAVYAFDFLDLKTVFVSACSAVLGCGTDWPQYTTLSWNGEVLAKPQGNVSYSKSDTSYQSTVTLAQKVSVESRSLVFYRMSDSYGVLVWDFVDQDDLYPVKPETTIKRDLIGAAMVRRELCHDGVERVVYRSICTKLHSFSLPATAPEVANYLEKSEEGAKACGDTVFSYIRDHASEAAGMVSV
ncbi:Transportin-3 [Phytophthora pseudosyringae]|uniref:Transportin-3 n=1 Tax=Phytophthora pseudosyringae TaxID=221518 RepID=A0A8T1WAV5_9STRA|nr:Transportin-3 [Phytophthora pseudosyringae]